MARGMYERIIMAGMRIRASTFRPRARARGSRVREGRVLNSATCKLGQFSNKFLYRDKAIIAYITESGNYIQRCA